MNNEYDIFKSQYNRGSGKEIYEKLKEADEWIKSLHERFQDKGYKQTNHIPIVDKLISCLGYFGILRDKLKDELIFNKDTLRALNLQVKRIEKDLETRKSDLERQVELRDSTRKEFTTIQDRRDKADKSLSDYLDIEEDYYCVKKKKELAEEIVRKNVIIYQNNTQAAEIMKISSEQSKISLEQGKEILERVEKAIDEINLVYHKVMLVIADKKKVLQITGGENE